MVDGQAGFGQTVGPQAVDIGIAKAKATGLAVVALRNSAHIGRIGDWGERAAAAGLVSLHFVNVADSLLVAPFGGRGRRMATNPVCIGIPPMDGPGDAAARHGHVGGGRGQGDGGVQRRQAGARKAR